MHQPTRGEEIAWAAGLFEGEGCITVSNRGLTTRITNTDPELIERFLGTMDIGRMYGPYRWQGRDGYRRKPFFHWVASGVEALEVLEILGPWLSQRRLVRAYELTGLRFPCGMGSLRHDPPSDIGLDGDGRRDG